MTNAEKFEEIFGFPHENLGSCTHYCEYCVKQPCEFWKREYKENEDDEDNLLR